MRICGVSFGSEVASIVAIECKPDKAYDVLDSGIRKIQLSNHEDENILRDFARTLSSFIRDNKIDAIVIRKCTYKGKYMSGAAAIKMEALFQLNQCKVILISPQTIKSTYKKSKIAHPNEIKAYQHEAFETAVAYYCGEL